METTLDYWKIIGVKFFGCEKIEYQFENTILNNSGTRVFLALINVAKIKFLVSKITVFEQINYSSIMSMVLFLRLPNNSGNRKPTHYKQNQIGESDCVA